MLILAERLVKFCHGYLHKNLTPGIIIMRNSMVNIILSGNDEQ